MLTMADHTETTTLPGVQWQNYLRIRDDLERSGSRRRRVFFGQEGVFVVTPSHRHDFVTDRVRIAAQEFAFRYGISIDAGRSTTLRHTQIQRAAEGDDCLWIRRPDRNRRRHQLDLAVDPPPDVVIETEVTHPADPRLSIYAELGVGEVWRVRTGAGWSPVVTMFVWEEGDAAYREVRSSRVLEGCEASWLEGLLVDIWDQDLNTFVATVRASLEG